MNLEKLTVTEIKKYLDSLDMETVNIESICNDFLLDKRSSVKNLINKFEYKYKKYINIKKNTESFYNFDRQYILNNNYVIAGCDEVGRGPLAGPIVCASVILDLYNDDSVINNINDSKKIKSKEVKKSLSELIKNKSKFYSIIEISNEEIDCIGIGVANQKGLKESIEILNTKIDLVLSDGYLVKNLNYKNISVVKGDTKSASIMCAAIIAKVYRDELMYKLHEEYPQYDFINNVGYGTSTHVKAIEKYGICKYHRKSFLKNYLL